MQAIGYRSAGGSGVLEAVSLPDPVPGSRDLLVRVTAVSVNPIDVKLRAKASPRDGEIKVLGYDATGIVEATGDEVQHFRPGDAVFHIGALARPGTNAELHLVDERLSAVAPRTLSSAQTAALPLTAITAWEMLFEKLRVVRGEESSGRLLVVNGAGGVGSILVQLAAKLTGLSVIATASRPETVDWVRDMGADLVIDHREPLDAALKAAGVDAVDCVACLGATAEHMPAIAKVIAPLGRIAIADDPKTLDITPLRARAVSIAWEGMFVRSTFRTADMGEQGRILSEVARLVDAGILRSTVHDDFGPMTPENLAAAHDHVATGRAIGKSILGAIES